MRQGVDCLAEGQGILVWVAHRLLVYDLLQASREQRSDDIAMHATYNNHDNNKAMRLYVPDKHMS